MERVNTDWSVEIINVITITCNLTNALLNDVLSLKDYNYIKKIIKIFKSTVSTLF